MKKQGAFSVWYIRWMKTKAVSKQYNIIVEVSYGATNHNFIHAYVSRRQDQHRCHG